MNASLSIILNKSFFYNKKIAILFFIILSLLVFVTFFDKGFEISRGNIFLISTLCFGISISLYWLIKEKNYEFHKYSFNIDEYRLSSKKDKEKSYNEVYNKLLSEELKNINSNTSKKIDEFLSNVQNELNKNLRKLITFERFDDYFTRPKKDETTSRLFYFQYKKSLIKIIKDFIVNTNELEDISNEIISRFISELTNYKNLHFENDLGLHYDDMFAINFLEDYKKQELTNEIEHQKEILKDIKQIELKNISKTQFYKVLEKTSIDVLKVQLTKENQEELKSFVGNLFTTKIKCNLSYDSNINKLNFINSENSKLFIMVMRYLQDKTMINLYNIDLIRTLDLIIKTDSIITDSNKRISVIKSVTYQKLTPKQIKNVENILRNSKTQHT
ncbi:hypothetical protein [Empedobacter falsenii]|uniref:Uncharacterized protein n=1 Tax=Empedobacter falsenii TaxID=343874 RepID=A0AAW7DLE5_9FLAO|nr:hypothetical protein [Empedobacter falsenii]MDM1552395.1 hypothetical protein [Empedobacter falsenii]